MEPEINCSEFCDSLPGQELDRRPLHELCRTTITSAHSSTAIRSVSPALLGVVWTFLSCGLLLMLFFLAFTIRCRKNRIVKMSSPNLNMVTLLGSCLTYSSAYLFGIQDITVGSSMETLIQMRLSMLCIGTSLVFGPILGKSWRLYKVFTQRVPDKRVIIKDLQLLGLVAALVVADVILLVTWVLTDPVQCLQILGVRMTVTGREVSCSLTDTHYCASRYSDVWIALVLGCKGLLLLYGAYLAGLTDHVSSPPVNQSLTIMVGVNLLLLAAGLLFVVTRYLHSWPNLVFGLTSGGIFVCTTTVNCCIFLPQFSVAGSYFYRRNTWIVPVLLKQWKAFEGENQTIRRMAKYFSTPSKTFHTQFGEDQNGHLEEKSSMERLLTEKNAVIESLQEQVNNAKEKLVKLMSTECTYDPSEWPVAPASAQSQDAPAAASVQEPLERPSASENYTHTAAEDSRHTSGTSQQVQSPRTPGRNITLSPGQKEKMPLKDCCEHLDLGCSQNLQTEESQHRERGGQRLPAPNQSLMSGEGAHEPQGPRPISDELPQRLPRVSSVVREKLREVLQELDLGPEAPLSSSLPCPQQPCKGSASRSPQRLPLPRVLGFSPYLVRRRRRVAHRAQSHLPGSVPPSAENPANRTVSGVHKGLNVQSSHSPRLDLQSAGSKVPRPRKTPPLSDSHQRPLALEESKQCQSQPRGAGGCNAASPSQPSNAQALSPIVPCPTFSPRRRQPPSSVSPGCPSSASPCNYLDTESSSSDDFFCRCHRPYCEICFQTSSDSSDSSTWDSDPEPAGGLASWEKPWACSKPIVNFKDDLKPTLV